MPAYDLIVVGAGLAGLRAAIEAHDAGASVAILTKLHPVRSHSGTAEGGINAVLRPDDDYRDQMFETIKGSDYLADQGAVQVMCEEAARDIFQLEHWGVPFSRETDGRLAQRAFGGQTKKRTVFAADKTGHYILATLHEQALKREIECFEEWFALGLVRSANGKAAGILAINMGTGEIEGFSAPSVILATGPSGRAFSRTSTAFTCTGDGLSMAFRAGAALKDVEFVQFHPTGLGDTGVLITEACRGEGGRLYNALGERFLGERGYAPNMMELASRDVVARAIHREAEEGRGVNGCVFLDLRHLGEKLLKSRLPGTLDVCRDFAGIDPIKEPIPVKPTAHYMMGGISTDVAGAVDGIEGLFAAGECACLSIHGANRLGGNALLECVVFGRRSGAHAAEHSKGRPAEHLPESLISDERNHIESLLRQDGGEDTHRIRRRVQETMMADVSVARNASGLRRALEVIREEKAKFARISLRDSSRTFNTELIYALELRSILDVAEVITLSALAREESRGAHWREDFPKRDEENWLKHTYTRLGPDGQIAIEYKPVDVSIHAPKARRY